MKKITLAFALFMSGSAMAQTDNDYNRTVNKFQQFYNHSQTDSVFTMFSDRIKSMLPPDKTKEMLAKMYGEFGPINRLDFSKKDDRFSYYTTRFEKGVLTLVVFLTPENKLQSFRFTPYQPDTTVSNLSVKAGPGTIYGTLTVPATAGGKVPVVLIIPGSGPTDRDGNNVMGVTANSFKMIAEILNNAGIACARYDKRGIGESAMAMKDEASMRFDDMTDDACTIIKKLKADPRFSKVIVLGHSEGSLIGMIAARKEHADGFISVAGIAERADKIIKQQLGAQSKEMAQDATGVLDSLVKGYVVKQVPTSLASLFRPDVMPYMISWLKYDPQTELKKLTAKTMIIQGTTDIQVEVAQAQLLKKAKPTASLEIIKGMNHVLKEAPEDRQQNIAAYANPDLPLAPGFMSAVLQFVKAN